MDQPTIAGVVTLQPRYTGRARDLFPLFLGTLLLTIVTFGIYRFWARTRVRRHVWSHTVVLDDALEYTGTGKELFVGFLKAVLALTPIFVGFAALDFAETLYPEHGVALFGARVLLYAALGYLFLVGYYAALRYRLSRTRWRAIRFGQSGSPWRYGRIAAYGMVARAVTLGLYTPVYDVDVARYITETRRFGTEHFRFFGHGGDLFRPFFVCWLLLLPTVGLSWFWYEARRMRYIAERTGFAGLRLSMLPEVTGGKVMRLRLGNLMIALFTLGLCYPVIVRRNMRFWCDNLSASGTVDFQAIAQTAALAGSGEGLASFFDIDALGS